jgi:F420-non-reducing hydrogenase small subunit
MSIKISGESLNACSGCEISLLDMGENFLKLLEIVQIVHLPLLMDNKYIENSKNAQILILPNADIGLISGSIKTYEHLQLAKAMRESCDFIIGSGTCATHGGIPALANSYHNEQIKNCCFKTVGTDETDNFPTELVPEFLERCYALDEKIKVDYYLPGCPPHPDHLFSLISALAKGETYLLPEKSVCDNCFALREGIGRVSDLKRPLNLPDWKDYQDSENLDQFKCFIEQGFLCMGPVTQDGCGGGDNYARCITAGVPCRGCYGPIQNQANQKLAILNALASNDINIDSLPEKVSLLRFSGGHGRLRPISPK